MLNNICFIGNEKEPNMGLRIVYGRAGTGKSSFCFRKIKEQIKEKEKIYVITPEQFSFTAEKKLLDTVGSSTIHAEVITFNRIANRILTTIEGIKENILNDSAKQMLLYYILLEQKEKLNFLGKSEENIELLFNTITELKKHNINIHQLENGIQNTKDNYLKLKLQDIYEVYSQYEKRIMNHYLDVDDLLTQIATSIEKSGMFQNSIIYIDEFVGFTPQEYEIIKILLKIAKSVTITICSDDITNTPKDMFYSNNKTAQKLLKLAKEQNINTESLKLEQKHRFKNEELKILEKNLYAFRLPKVRKRGRTYSTALITRSLSRD